MKMELAILLPLVVWLLALVLDYVYSEPRYHPIIVFGNIATKVESFANQHVSPLYDKLNGSISVLLLVFLPSLGIWYLSEQIQSGWIRFGMDSLILWSAIGWGSMKQHARAISEPLLQDDLQAARSSLSMIVSRDTEDMQVQQIVGSTLESTIENGNDCLFASLFWYLLLGPAGVVMHRLSNTLDAMWGYKTKRYLDFGFAAAKLDDLLGWIPARLTALSYGLAGSLKGAWQSYRLIRGKHKSVNAGLVMASGAGALGVRFGGAVSYHGRLENKPELGVGRPVQIADIEKAIQLIQRSVAVWIIVYVFIALCVLVLR